MLSKMSHSWHIWGLLAILVASCYGDGTPLKCPAGKKAITVEEDAGSPRAVTPFSFEDIFDSRYRASSFSARWSADKTKPTFIYRNKNGALMNKNAATGADNEIMPASVFSDIGASYYFVSEDQTYVLLAYETKKIWRHSYEAKYKLWDVVGGQLVDYPNGPMSGSVLQIARFGQKGISSVFVYNYNLYYQANVQMPPIQITTDGKENEIFNALPDWMYEEDVIHSEQAFTFSPDSGHLVFARFDTIDVPHQAWPLYGDSETYFPEIVEIPYPKAGDLRDGKPGPTTKVQLYTFSTANLAAGVKRIPPPAAWSGADHYYNQISWRDGHNALITWVNRVQNRTIQMMCDVYADPPSCTEFKDFTQKDGWVDCRQPSQRFVNNGNNLVTVMQDPATPELWMQATYMSTPEKGHGVILYHTSRAEDVKSIAGFDEENQLIYYLGTNGDPTERHLFKVGTHLAAPPDQNPICMTCAIGDGCKYVSASFSADGKHYVLGCLGPDVPEYYLKHTANSNSEVLEDNAAHKAAIADKAMPTREFIEIPINGGYMGSAEVFYPPNFSENQKYPLFVYAYAGPENTRVYKSYPVGSYSSNWLRYLSSSHNVIVASVDGRGSLSKGNKFVFEMYRKLGDVEVQDQIEAGLGLQSFPFIDLSMRSAIYGWSYGGHTAAHVIGDPTQVFTCGIAVAPVTAKRYYDSAYTERYLAFATDDDNAGGYDREDVMNKVENFRGKKFYVASGTADDNVHFMHMTQLVHALEDANIPHYQGMYIDTNHNIAEIHNARHLREAKTRFLLEECWEGKAGSFP